MARGSSDKRRRQFLQAANNTFFAKSNLTNAIKKSRAPVPVKNYREQQALTADLRLFILGYDDEHPGAWSILEPNTELDWNWSHDLITEELIYLAEGFSRRVVMNVAPRSLKSLIVSVFFPCWVWMRAPWESFLCLSYSTPLANDHSYKRRQIIESDWYQAMTDGKCILSDDRNRITEYSNVSGGIMYARGLDGSVTGVGGNYIICLPCYQKVTTTEGEIPIGDIVCDRMDVEVLTWNHETNQSEWQPILRYEENPSYGKEIIEIELEDGTILEVTEDHPVWVQEMGCYVPAGALTVGDTVACHPSNPSEPV